MSKKSSWGVFLLIFIFFIYFYAIEHRPVMTTADDWNYLSYTRDAIPVQAEHNPTKVFPETLMPLTALVSTSVFMPICNDFVQSIVLGSAIVLSLFITLYAFSFYKLLKKRLFLDEISSLFVTVLFLLFHFLIFRTLPSWNKYLLGSYNLTCYYNYTIPILCNASLVMYLLSHKYETESEAFLFQLSPWKKGFLVLFVYLCMFSNLYANILLTSYIGLSLLQKLIINWKKQTHLSFAKNNILAIVVLFVYLIILWMESHGHNANSLGMGRNSFSEDLALTLQDYQKLFPMFNKWYLFVTIIAIIAASWSLWKNKRQESLIRYSIFFGLWFIILNIFSILISAKANPNYVIWQDRMLMEFFCLLLVSGSCFGLILKYLPQIKWLMPLLFFILFCHTNTRAKTFNEVTFFAEHQACNYQLIEQIQKADRLGKDSLTLYVPNFPSIDNWPMAVYMGRPLSDVFSKLGLIKKPLNITITPVKGHQGITDYLLPNEKDSIVIIKDGIKDISEY